MTRAGSHQTLHQPGSCKPLPVTPWSKPSPMVKTLTGGGARLQEPVPEITSLRRGESWRAQQLTIHPEESTPLEGVVGSALDIEVVLERWGFATREIEKELAPARLKLTDGWQSADGACTGNWATCCTFQRDSWCSDSSD